MERWATIKDEITLEVFNKLTFGIRRGYGALDEKDFDELKDTAFNFTANDKGNMVYVDIILGGSLHTLTYNTIDFDTIYLEIDDTDIE